MPPARLTAAATSRQCVKAKIGNSMPNISQSRFCISDALSEDWHQAISQPFRAVSRSPAGRSALGAHRDDVEMGALVVGYDSEPSRLDVHRPYHQLPAEGLDLLDGPVGVLDGEVRVPVRWHLGRHLRWLGH